MNKYFTSLAAAAVLGLGITQASADDHRPRHHDRHSGWSVGITIGDPFYDPYFDPYEMRHVRPVARGCTVERASDKARHYGIRHQRIYKSDWTIKVKGIKHGHRAQITFAREPGCPVIR
ncbi:MAG: hypothetical protein WCC66_07855 [Rhizobiaceae bacterium]